MIVSEAGSAAVGSQTRLSTADARHFLFREARYLDEHLWDEWLDLFAPDARYWMPSWIDFEHYATDPDQELSLIFLDGKSRLEERIWRLESGRSVASTPLSRTMHQISNVEVDPDTDNTTTIVRSNFTVHLVSPRRVEPTVFFGRYRHTFQYESRWLIAEKKILLLNDYLPSFIDVYTV